MIQRTWNLMRVRKPEKRNTFLIVKRSLLPRHPQFDIYFPRKSRRGFPACPAEMGVFSDWLFPGC